MSSESSPQESSSSSPSVLAAPEYFKDSQHFSIGDHSNFSTVHGDHIQHYYNTEVKKRKFIVGSEEEEAEYEQFPEIKRADFVAIRNICCSDGRLYDFEQRKFMRGERTLVVGDVRIGGVASKCLVMQYSGQGAGELWKKDFRVFGGLRHPENAQLVAINLSNVPMLVLTGELVPAAHLMDQVGELGRVYLRTLADQMGCYRDDSLWMDTSRGVFCRGPEGPYCNINSTFDLKDLPLDAELMKEAVLVRYLGNRNLDRRVVWGLSLDWRFGSSQLKVNRPTVISTLTDAFLAVGSGVREVGEDEEEWCCVGEREELANGVTRFPLKHDGRRLELYFQGRGEAIDDWLGQAPSIFHAHGIPLEGDMHEYKLVCPEKLTGWLSESEVKRRRRKNCLPIYLFIPPLSMSIFWSFDPDGQNPITTNLCHHLGLPISLSLQCYVYSWPTQTYKTLQAYQIARGFDPNTTEFARHNQYRIYEITDQPFTGRYKEINNSEPTETPLPSIQPEEFNDMFLEVLFGDVLPEDLDANTPTQDYALQKDFVGVPDTAHIECILPADLKSISPSETEDAVPQSANTGWSRFIPTFSWAALEDSDIHSAGF